MPMPMDGSKRRENGALHTLKSLRTKTMLDRKTGCWNWTMSLSSGGYGQVTHGSKTYKANRLAWILRHPHSRIAGKLICHKCDNRKCINPAHLYAGTHLSNMRDMIRKGRHRFPGGAKGEKHRDAKLNRNSILVIRASSFGCRILSAAFSVDSKTIRDIKNRRTWKHIP